MKNYDIFLRTMGYVFFILAGGFLTGGFLDIKSGDSFGLDWMFAGLCSLVASYVFLFSKERLHLDKNELS